MRVSGEATRMTIRVPSNVKIWVRKQALSKGISENAHISLLLQKEMAAEDKFGDEASAADSKP